MRYLILAWNWLDGSKTAIGLALQLAIPDFVQAGLLSPGAASQAIHWVAVGITVLGIIHKVVKAVQNAPIPPVASVPK